MNVPAWIKDEAKLRKKEKQKILRSQTCCCLTSLPIHGEEIWENFPLLIDIHTYALSG